MALDPPPPPPPCFFGPRRSAAAVAAAVIWTAHLCEMEFSQWKMEYTRGTRKEGRNEGTSERATNLPSVRIRDIKERTQKSRRGREARREGGREGGMELGERGVKKKMES